MSDILKRKNNESQYDYIKRLIYGKLIDKTIDADYEDLSELIFGEGNCFNSSEVRKRAYGMKRIFEIIDEEKINSIFDDNILNELELKKIELEKERIKNRTIKLELNKMLRQDARFELFLEEIKNSIETCESPTFEEYVCDNGDIIGIVGISDIHYGKIFTSINNSYSMEICHQRMELLLNEIIYWIEDRNINYLHIINSGDSCEGLIRTNQIRVLETGVIDSVIEFSKMMTEWLNQLSKYIPLTYHHVISSNHTEVRFLNQPAGSFPDEDLEKVIIHMIAGSFRDSDRVSIPIYTTDYAYFTVNNKNIFACHGHQFRNKKVSDILKELRILHRINIDILILGHYHHEEIITVGENENGNIKVILLPAIMGSDNFSDTLFTGAKAGATLIEVSDKKGLTTTEVVLN